MISIGEKFPEFNLVASSDKPFETLNIDNAFLNITDKSYPDMWKVIFFYPKDFTFVCPTEIVAFGNLFDEFKQRNTQILGCSVDSEFVHWAWRTHNPSLKNLPFPLLADVKRELTNALGIINQDSGVAERALFILDPQNVVKFIMVTDSKVGRNPHEVLRVLDALQSGELCQCGWIRGNKGIDVKNVKL